MSKNAKTRQKFSIFAGIQIAFSTRRTEPDYFELVCNRNGQATEFIMAHEEELAWFNSLIRFQQMYDHEWSRDNVNIFVAIY